MKKLTHLLLLLVIAVSAAAQDAGRQLRKFVVADIETRVPMRGVVVYTGDGYRDTTNYRGICYVPADFDTLSVYRHGYLTERLLPKEVADSTFLIPDSRRISEVTVWGNDGSGKLTDDLDEWIKRQGGLPSPSSGMVSIGFDFARMLDKRARRDAKHLKKVTSSFKAMDEEDDDPIVAAYNRAMEQQRLEKELQKAKEERAEKIKRNQQEQIERRKASTQEAAKELEQTGE